MSKRKKIIKLTENDLKNIIKKSVERVFEENDYSQLLLVPLDENTIRNQLVEGLIISYPLEKVVSYISKSFMLDRNMNNYLSNPYNKYGVIISLKSNNSTDVIMVALRKGINGVYEQIVNSMENLCGWQLSCVVNNTPTANGYPKWFINSHYILQFEKRIDNDATEDVFSRKNIYHVCPLSKIEKIKHIGLTPRDSTWSDFKHKGRIYFYLNKPNISNISKEFSRKNVVTNGYALLTIDLSLIDKTTQFFYDPRQPGGVITTDNIPPQAITVSQY